MKNTEKGNGRRTTIAEELQAGRPVATYTKGTSMEPLLREGKTYVVIEPLQRELQIGDLPIYRRPDGIYVIHRLIGFDGACCLTRGDNCLTYERIPQEWILGCVTEIHGKRASLRVTDRRYQFYVRFWEKSWWFRKCWYRIRSFLRDKWKGCRILCKKN